MEALPAELLAKLRAHGWWTPRSGVVQPATLRHPETGRETLQLYSFSHGQTQLALEARCLCPARLPLPAPPPPPPPPPRPQAYHLARQKRPELPQVDKILYSGPDQVATPATSHDLPSISLASPLEPTDHPTRSELAPSAAERAAAGGA